MCIRDRLQTIGARRDEYLDPDVARDLMRSRPRLGHETGDKHHKNSDAFHTRRTVRRNVYFTALDPNLPNVREGE